MLRVERNENGEKNNNRAALFFCTFLCRYFARLQRETSINFLVTRFMEEMLEVFLCTFFHCRPFSPWWPPASRRHKMSCCYYSKRCLLFCFSPALPSFLVELRCPVALLSLVHCLSFSLYSKFVDMTINLSLIL